MHTLAQLRSGELAGISRLDLSCGLTELPPEVFALADSLEVLNLSGNALSSLPDDLPRLHKLKVLFCSENRFTELPVVVGACASLSMVGFKSNQLTKLPAAALPAQLRWLILTDNQLTELPAELGERPHLQKLALAGNRLRELPDSMAQCRRLSLLRMSANRFQQIPPWLLELPHLAWLAVGGNPWGAQRESRVLEQSNLPDLDWAALQMGELLGQGASGVIHAAHWPSGPADQRGLAVKVFKGEVTSDGWPHSEWAASLAAGLHPHLISASARLVAHPQGAEGLVMPRIGGEFSTLAGPPSLSSCTRDVYPAATQMGAEVLQRMARGVVDAASHLHRQGISHGDLYAHNLLWNGRGEVHLGDFGAASLLPDHLGVPARQAFERLEVLAFGHLLEEWLSRCPDAPPALQQLQAACVSAEPGARPLFAEVAAALS
ncbi:leucine-rich repeat-containing protein kinase family protein [Roseateles oligotrophus]|uniref:Leucine-rich repeat-containing serine/threonine-protein kinase n=1 Tax=Roseateles oligotrophus TaxID=1769250 RepID=A0ABT2YDQ1_9BURK|nr:leucine-rich repeat-containing protein kinase family protein [Roseateles oligotrophus]MCV2368125.1 leucine-rich repeat-containing serine/threonine-protein kinase [Roseateles oligotrophus]